MDKEKIKILKNLQYGDVIVYSGMNGMPFYLIVEKVENEKVKGAMGRPVGINCISIDELLERKDLRIAFKSNCFKEL